MVFILPGQKKQGKCYGDIKKLLIKEMPVPSQVVLASTISRGKNLRSIVTKILIQMNAKMGGIPWSIKETMPFYDRPTMVVGYDVCHTRGKKSMLALCATVNNKANRYFSRVTEQAAEISDRLQQVFVDALEAFKKANNIYPQRIIIYRDGVGEGQKETLFQ